MTHATHSGWDHFNGGPWECTLPVPKNWEQVKKSEKTKTGDKCIVVIVPEKPLRNTGKSHKIKGKWEPISEELIGYSVWKFNAVIRLK